MADYLTCSFFDDSRLGRDFFGAGKPLRQLDNALKFENMENVEVHEGGKIWGGAFWELRRKFGRDEADKLLFQAWVSQKSAPLKGDQSLSFVNRVLESDKKLAGGKHREMILAVFQSRGLKAQ
jgi:hypothetical protein